VVHSTVSFEEEGFDVRLDRMATELDGLVRFLRRGVEGLATGVDDVAPVFGTWAFALDDWDK
jgi:gamma-tubulin complex component 5